MKESPSPGVVRTQYGLGAGSCFQYRVIESQGTVLAVVAVSGPNTTQIAGRSVFVRSYRRLNVSLPSIEESFDTETDGAVRLLMSREGPAGAPTIRRYGDDSSPPLFARFSFDRGHAPVLDGERFETSSTPRDMPTERHVWNVLAKDEPVMTPDGMKTAYKLQYVRGAQSAIYDWVPGFGLARFVDFSNVVHQVCAARVCDDEGVCTGAASCDALECSL